MCNQIKLLTDIDKTILLSFAKNKNLFSEEDPKDFGVQNWDVYRKNFEKRYDLNEIEFIEYLEENNKNIDLEIIDKSISTCVMVKQISSAGHGVVISLIYHLNMTLNTLSWLITNVNKHLDDSLLVKTYNQYIASIIMFRDDLRFIGFVNGEIVSVPESVNKRGYIDSYDIRAMNTLNQNLMLSIQLINALKELINEDEFPDFINEIENTTIALEGFKESLPEIIRFADDKRIIHVYAGDYEDKPSLSQDLQLSKMYFYDSDEDELINKSTDNEETVNGEFTFKNVNEEEQIVTGAVLIPDKKDLHKQWIGKNAIRKAMIKYMLEAGVIGFMHKKALDEKQVSIIENYQAPQDLKINKKEVKEGTWILSLKILDKQLWNKVKSKKINGFSIGGIASVLPEKKTA